MSNSAIAAELGVDRDTVALWRERAAAFVPPPPPTVPDSLTAIDPAAVKRLEDQARREFRKAVLTMLDDRPRSGAPTRYSAESVCAVVAVALEVPLECGVPVSHWSAASLGVECRKRGIDAGMSDRTIGRVLNEADLKPHKSRYWCNPVIDDPAAYEAEVKVVCKVYEEAMPAQQTHQRHTISVDEKTGIQALQRQAPHKPPLPGHVAKIEHNYRRHGTLCLMPSFDVATGRIVEATIGPTRTEEDFCNHIAATVQADPNAEWVFVCDRLNTHMSTSLVKWVAERCGINEDLGEKGCHGILKNRHTRRDFLSNCAHRIRFVYTPKHASWLNQVEIWFSILSRRLLKRLDVNSKEALAQHIRNFITYFNDTMAKAFKWTYKGRPLQR